MWRVLLCLFSGEFSYYGDKKNHEQTPQMVFWKFLQHLSYFERKLWEVTTFRYRIHRGCQYKARFWKTSTAHLLNHLCAPLLVRVSNGTKNATRCTVVWEISTWQINKLPPLIDRFSLKLKGKNISFSFEKSLFIFLN